jgi:5-methylcytosine-specific restriction endonuclease McrA
MIMERTLLLSQGYEPIATIGWQRAISLLTLGKVEVVEEYDREIRSRYLIIKMPAVVRLVNMFRRHKQRVKFSRQNIMARDRWSCQYCGTKVTTEEMTMDHVVPRSQGGRTEWENIVTCCVDCNAKKADRTPRQASMRLRKEPERPSWVPIFTIRLVGNMPDQWASYLYWNTELVGS